MVGYGLANAGCQDSSWLNFVSVRAGALANNVTGWIKVGALLVFGVVGPLLGIGDAAHLQPLVRGITEVVSNLG